jgi:hypothetical protein
VTRNANPQTVSHYLSLEAQQERDLYGLRGTLPMKSTGGRWASTWPPLCALTFFK